MSTVDEADLVVTYDDEEALGEHMDTLNIFVSILSLPSFSKREKINKYLRAILCTTNTMSRLAKA